MLPTASNPQPPAPPAPAAPQGSYLTAMMSTFSPSLVGSERHVQMLYTGPGSYPTPQDVADMGLVEDGAYGIQFSCTATIEFDVLSPLGNSEHVAATTEAFAPSPFYVVADRAEILTEAEVEKRFGPESTTLLNMRLIGAKSVIYVPGVRDRDEFAVRLPDNAVLFPITRPTTPDVKD